MKLAATGILLAALAIGAIAILQTFNSPETNLPFSFADSSPLFLKQADLLSLTEPQLTNSLSKNFYPWRGNSNSAPKHVLAPGIYETRPFAGIILVPYLGANSDVQPVKSPAPDPYVRNPGLEFIPLAPLPRFMTNAVPD